MKAVKLFPIILIASSLFLSCAKDEKFENLQWKGDAQKEIAEKMIRVQEFLNANKLDGILLTQVRNVYWMTAGLANNQIVLNKDVGAASILIMKDGKKHLICSGSEAGRMMDESLGKLGYELKMYNWYEASPVKDVRGEIIKQFGKIGSDIDFPNTINVAGKFKELRYSLTESELERYRELGKAATEAVVDVCLKIKPGMDEYEIEAMTSNALRNRGILPTVLLTAVDERIYKYRHALPGGAKLNKYAMVNVVAEKWGMPIAVTRFVHFGPLPDELKSKLEKVAVVNAHYQEATRPGTQVSEIFDQMKNWYAKVGYEGEWMKHHQGGATGYDDREWVAYPGIKEFVRNNQTFAWNPTITGTKVEETMVVNEKGFEVVTKTKDWPMIIVDLNGKKYPQPAIMIRGEKGGKPTKQNDYEIDGNLK